MAALRCWRTARLSAKRLKLDVREAQPLASFSSSSLFHAEEKSDESLLTPKPGISKDVDDGEFGATLGDAIGPQDAIRYRLLKLARRRNIPIPPALDPDQTVRMPRSVQALYLAPLRREPTHGNVVANLQLRSFSPRHVEFMADFAMRAAFYLDLPARGPVSLPRITNRWTVPKSHFIFKKTQQNFERVTMRRLVQILDGHPDSVRRWLGFVRKWQWHGVGLKADVYEWEDLDVVKRMDENAAKAASDESLQNVEWELFGQRKHGDKSEVRQMLDRYGFGNASQSPAASSSANAA